MKRERERERVMSAWVDDDDFMQYRYEHIIYIKKVTHRYNCWLNIIIIINNDLKPYNW